MTTKKYGVIEGVKDGKKWVGNVNLLFSSFISKEKLPWLVTIKIHLPMTDNNGLPTNNEANVLNEFEDELLALMQQKIDLLYIGRISWNGIREVFLQVSSAEVLNDLLSEYIKTERYPREFEYEIKNDPEWKNVQQIFKLSGFKNVVKKFLGNFN